MLAAACSCGGSSADFGDSGSDDGSSSLDSRAVDASGDAADTVDSEPSDAGGVDSAGADSNRIDANDAGSCNSLVNGATQLFASQDPSAAPPQSGGMIVDGTYSLTSAVLYTGAGGASGASTLSLKMTIQISGATFQSVNDDGSKIDRLTYALMASADTLMLTRTCPDPRIENGNYTATANTLTLSSYFSASSALVLTFVKL